MKTANILGVSYYIPEQKLTNEDIAIQHPEWSVEKISAKTGIYERGVSRSDELVSDLAYKAAINLFTDYDIDRSTIDFVLLCTQSPDYFLPTTACILHERLGLQKTCGALDFNLGCSGYIYGLGLAKGLIISGSAKNVLLITSETYTKYIHPDDKSNKTIFGDGAAATLISEQDCGLVIGDFVYGTDGSGAQNLIVKNGGSKNRHTDFENMDSYLFMDGSEIFKFTAERVPELVEETIKKNKLKKEDVSMFLFHQANKYMLDYIRRKMNINEEHFFYFLEKTGNTVSSTIPIALKEALNQKKILPDNSILLAGFGVGYSYAACVLKCNG